MFETWWEAIGIQKLQKTNEQDVINFGYPKSQLVFHISKPIQQMGSGNIITTDVSYGQCIDNAKEAYRSTNRVNHVLLILKQIDRCTGRDHME